MQILPVLLFGKKRKKNELVPRDFFFTFHRIMESSNGLGCKYSRQGWTGLEQPGLVEDVLAHGKRLEQEEL